MLVILPALFEMLNGVNIDRAELSINKESDEAYLYFLKLQKKDEILGKLFCNAVITHDVMFINSLCVKIQENFVDILEYISVHGKEGDYLKSASVCKWLVEIYTSIKNSNGNFIIE